MNKKLTIALLSLPTLSVSMLASCQNKANNCSHSYSEWRADKEAGNHYRYCDLCGDIQTEYHSFNPEGTVLKEATCKEDGLVSYVCDVCHFAIEETVEKTNNHHYDTYISSNEKNHTVECSLCGASRNEQHIFDIELPNEEFLKTSATCESQASYYKSCACGRSSKGTAYESTFVIGPKTNHSIYGLSIKSNPTKLSYLAYEKFDPTGLVLSYKCLNCGDQNLEATPSDGITFTYEGTNNSFRVGETTITANYLGKSIVINSINVSKNTNDIYGLEDINTSCGNTVNLNNITSKLGKVNVQLLDKDGSKVEGENNSYVVYEEKAPYTIKAQVEGNVQFDGVEEREATINVAHLYNTDNDENISLCKCGKKAVEKFYYDTESKQLYTSAAFGEKVDIAINGDYTDPDTGLYPLFEDIQPFENKIIQATKDGESISFYVTGVSKIITTSDELNENLWAREHDVTGYFLLGNDIEEWVTPELEGNIGSGGGRVKVTIDGLGHHIKKFITGSKYGGIFGTRYLVGSLFTDIHFDSINTLVYNGGIFGYVGDSLQIKNCSFVINQASTCIISGVLAYSDNYFENCVFDFQNFNNTYIMASYGNSNDKLTFKNTTIYYTEGQSQTIYRGVTTNHKESGITWIKK